MQHDSPNPIWSKTLFQGGALVVVLLAFAYLLYNAISEIKPALLSIPRVEALMQQHRQSEVYNLRTCIAVSTLAKMNPALCHQPLRPNE